MTSPASQIASGRTLPTVAAVLASILAVASLPAQTADTPAAESAKSDEVIILSPFNVSGTKENGYQAANSIGATRSSTPIKDVPLNIQVFTKDLADDIAANSQIDLERYNAALVNGNADSHSSNAIQQAYNAFLFRGFVQNWGLRDGIREYDPVDMQGVARVEIVKGPAAPLYGLAYPGGIMNTITKQVDFTHSFGDVRLSAQSYGEYRVAVDANYIGNVGDGGKFGVRVNAARANTEDDRKNSGGVVRYTQLNLAWMPTPQTEIKFLGENGYRAKPALVTGNFFSRSGTNGAETPLQIVHPNIPWTWNTADKHNVRDDDTFKYRGTVTQTISEDFSVTAYVETNGHKQSDTNGFDAAGGGGSNASWDMGWAASALGALNTGWITNEAGQEVIREAYHTRSWNNTVHAYGATAVYKLDLGETKNTITAGGNAWAEHFYSIKGTTRNGSNQYIDLPISNNLSTNSVPQFPGSDYYVDIGATPDENNANDYLFASWQLSALDNRLKVNAAINRTNIKLVQHSATPNITKVSKNSPMIGAMYDVTKEISVFAVHSTSLFPTSDKNDFDKQMPPVTGDSYEGGLKVELMGGKISGTISYYEITQKGGSQRDPSATNRNQTIWDSLTPTERLVRFPNNATRASLNDRGGSPGDLVAGGTAESKGYEADLIFQPTPEWQVMVSYAHNDQEVTKAVNAATIGQSTSGHIKDQFALLTKYTFTEGPVNGLSLGMGMQMAGKALQDYSAPGATARYNPSTFYAEVFAGYKFKAFGYDHKIQLNLKNLTKQDNYTGWYAKSGSGYAVDRYKVPSKMIWNLSYDLQF